MDKIGEFERKVAVWEKEADEELAGRIKIGCVVMMMEGGSLKEHVLLACLGVLPYDFVK